VPTYEWAVLRVVPRVERGEFVNVGVVLHCKALGYLGCVISDDLSRAVALDPGLDVDAVRGHLTAIADVCAAAPASGGSGQRSPGDRFRWLVAPRSTVVQPSPVHAGISDDPAAELAALMARMVAAPAAPGEGRARRSPG
jgi:hypothetical protein